MIIRINVFGAKNIDIDQIAVHLKSSLTIEDVTCSYPNVTKHALENINISVSRNDLIGIIGPVGAGKSSIFNLILNDLDISNGSINNSMSISLAPQEPWIFEGSFKQNILIGREYNELRYMEVLDASCLINDIKLFPNGDETYIVGVNTNCTRFFQINYCK